MADSEASEGRDDDGGGRTTPEVINVITALGHPLRRRIMRRLEGAGVARSPAELSIELNNSLSGVSYHVRVLKRKGIIRLTDQRQARGSMEHFYASNVTGNRQVKSILAETKAHDE